eukprot:Gregarina_sp_Poly_1__9305@NODE_577_length_7456_cov_92_259304_g451_i0_p2_GENE_NODE_577_length_7456_cov_92_259304_g451_i0NODE_577_length_7456_cov_92_259304_g451_i0_p2_ORF_typecomplete_len410_score52_05Thioredoxin/PF00085_20/1_2e11Thioredoxin_2/PF13098_6/0_00046OST3_OST6/PF04756_13/1_3e03OST3_OST6/PF04756_13/0_0009Phosducin/PF02114_16/0_00079Thioredoxin_7/PF13899_6/4_3e03Thioredoxin_7/PF13899_6/0_0061Thioredoxin_8/PF13905_6/2_9e03Thioredoxin_8/PF13905_6/0_029AhpCTSA/PF00578_21/0_13TraF/PF13728_6/4_
MTPIVESSSFARLFTWQRNSTFPTQTRSTNMLSRKRRDDDDRNGTLSSQFRSLKFLQSPRVVTTLYLVLVIGAIGLVLSGWSTWFSDYAGGDAAARHRSGSEVLSADGGAGRSKLRSRSTYLDWRGESSEWFKRSPQGRFVFVFYEGVVTQEDPIKRALEALSLQTPSKQPFAFASIASREYVDTFSNILSDSFLSQEFPAVLLLDVVDGYKKYLVPLSPYFAMDKLSDLDAVKFQEFLESQLLQPYSDRTLKPYLRSERLEFNEEGGDNSHNAVRPINSTFFHERLLTLREEPEFFVVFYAPWCGHCRRFHELFRPLARLVRHKTSSIGFYKMDSTKNDINHPGISVARVPHVRFFSKYGDMNAPVVVDHRAKEVTEENLRKFLLQHSHTGKSLARSWKVGEINLDEL